MTVTWGEHLHGRSISAISTDWDQWQYHFKSRGGAGFPNSCLHRYTLHAGSLFNGSVLLHLPHHLDLVLTSCSVLASVSLACVFAFFMLSLPDFQTALHGNFHALFLSKLLTKSCLLRWTRMGSLRRDVSFLGSFTRCQRLYDTHAVSSATCRVVSMAYTGTTDR